ncbi:hypothetical protein ACIQ7N_21735 [Lysinibacillus sp. NPDC095746]|uniref:hypothetical protein n=1 Tax=Lysinibacillus sp. NPDC095746 TaxID=3364134 RepID=UPI00380850B3
MSVRQGVHISLIRKVGIPSSKRNFYQLHSNAWTSTLHTSIEQGAMMAQYLRRAKNIVLEEQAISTIDESIEFLNL